MSNGLRAVSELTPLGATVAASSISWVVMILVNFAIAGAVGWTSWARDEQNERRKRAIEELTEANAKLEASLRENAGLHAQLLEQAREAGFLDERQRMAREIHDTLAQGLAGIITQLEAGLRSSATDDESRRRAEAAAQLARENLAEARRSVQALQPRSEARSRSRGARRSTPPASKMVTQRASQPRPATLCSSSRSSAPRSPQPP